MIIDFHTHGKLAKKLPFSSSYTDWLSKEASESGLDVICLTEHFNTIGFDDICMYIGSTYGKQGDCFLAENLRIFMGMEIDIAEGGHILVIGIISEIMELNHRLEQYKERTNFIPMEQLIAMVDSYEMLLGAAHPFRMGSHIPDLPDKLIERFDFIDLNGKDIAVDRLTTETKTYSFAKTHNIPVVAGSDTHQSFQYGCIKNVFEKDCFTINELGDEIKQGNYHIEIAESASFQVKTAGLLKQSLKEIHNLGGDYVSVLLSHN